MAGPFGPATITRRERVGSAVDALERRTGKPVVTSNQATIWAALRALGLEHPVRGFGRLLERVAAA